MAFEANETVKDGLEIGEHVSELLSTKKSVREALLNTHFHRDVHSQNDQQPFSLGAQYQELVLQGFQLSCFR